MLGGHTDYFVNKKASKWGLCVEVLFLTENDKEIGRGGAKIWGHGGFCHGHGNRGQSRWGVGVG